MSIPHSSSTASELNDFKEEGGKQVYNVSKSRLMSLIDWMTVFRRYIPLLWYVLFAVLVWQISYILFENRFDLKDFYFNEMAILELQRKDALNLGWKTMGVLAILLWYANRRHKPVYLIDFATFEPPEEWKVSPEQLLEIMRRQKCFTEESLTFMERMLKQSGCGPSTAWPPGIIRCLDNKPVQRTAEAAREEARIVIFDVVRQVLKKTKVNPKDINILVVNCSLFSPTPSLCSMVINEFGLKSDVSSYNLAGMGCSAGVISIELVKNLLASKPNSTALVVSTENLTQNLYHGNERSFLLQNTLFRCGGAAMVLTNKWTDAFRARFKLLHVVRTQYVSEDSFGCVYETEDETCERGVRLSKEIVKVAGRALEKNFTSLGPLVLPLSEQIPTGFWMLVRFLAKSLGLKQKISPYIPDFKRGIDHFCIHAGGRGVIDGIEKNLNLTPTHVAASRHALYAYGNTSSSSIWYEMDYIRNYAGCKYGQRVLQVAFGSGFKCNSAVWLCMNNPKEKNVPPLPPKQSMTDPPKDTKKTK
mmetsp:Transcript_1740/g.2958  ORF Transcript_1740/g.2958 Transcript_1740/m.2958 type:complete len:532 (-) Transcript_1740:479-2074(-)